MKSEIASAVATTCDRLLEECESVHPHQAAKVVQDEYADLIAEWADELAYERIVQQVKNYMRGMGRQRGEQLLLPGVGPVDPVITCGDGEGGFRVKKISKATAQELIEDEQIHELNVLGAIEAHQKAQERNQILVPLMTEHGFEMAGEAIEWLARNA